MTISRMSMLLASASLLIAPSAMAQVGDEPLETDVRVEDEIITIGTRRDQRTAADSTVPIDVISGVEFLNQASNDLQDLLRTSVPSYNVNTQPISDAATIIRPANLRGLSPDNTLVLVNGKRRHRGSVISFLGGGIADGAQGVDVSVIPALALKQVEVLRDGASSQYGSDAIAGVLNFQLKDAAEGGTIEGTYGSTYEGDGDFYRIAGNIGLPLGDRGFVNLTGEYSDVEGTVRSVVRGDVQNLIDAGYTPVADFLTINTYTDEVPQYWGQPDVSDDIKLFVNSGFEISDAAELYAFGNYAQRTVEGGFFFRNPTNRGGVYRGPRFDPRDPNGDPGNVVTLLDNQGTSTSSDDVYVAQDGTQFLFPDTIASVLVGDLDGLDMGGDCPAGIPLTGMNGLPNGDVLNDVSQSANCFSFLETIPSGFVPRFGGDLVDYSIAGGIRGDLDFGTGLSYDLSATYGTSDTEFAISNTINASLGPDTPRDFTPGAYQQTELVLDAAFVYAVPVSGFASDLNFAFGAQYRDEEFEITQGDPASFALGPLADQGFSSSSNGFGGFTQSLTASQDSYAAYVDVETDVTDALTVQGAVRYEDYSTFGDTFDWKVAGLYRLADNFRLRSSYSTGFHAPTAGQANVTNVTTQNVNGQLIDQGTIPLSSTPGQLAADFIEFRDGGRPELGPEEAKNFTLGAGFDFEGATLTVDYFNIDVDNRIALAENVDFLEALNFLADQNGLDPFADVSSALTALGNANIINRQDYVGFEDLTQYRYFSNSFDTRTEGIEVVLDAPIRIFDNAFNSLTFSLAYIDTTVTDRGEINPISESREAALEELLPELRSNVTFTHEQGPFRGLIRANYYGEWEDVGNGNGVQSGELLIDAEVAYEVYEGLDIIVGANNLFDNYPDENPDALALGQLYPEASPQGFNGGSYYAKLRYNF